MARGDVRRYGTARRIDGGIEARTKLGAIGRSWWSKELISVMEELAETHAGRVGFAKLSIDESPAVAARYRVLSIPTVMVFEGGEPRSTLVGARSRKHYEQALAEVLAPGS